jgi:hypothetical protein
LFRQTGRAVEQVVQVLRVPPGAGCELLDLLAYLEEPRSQRPRDRRDLVRAAAENEFPLIEQLRSLERAGDRGSRRLLRGRGQPGASFLLTRPVLRDHVALGRNADRERHASSSSY